MTITAYGIKTQVINRLNMPTANDNFSPVVDHCPN